MHSRQVECCFTCEEFPCQTHCDSEEAVYTKQTLDSWKELRRTGLRATKENLTTKITN